MRETHRERTKGRNLARGSSLILESLLATSNLEELHRDTKLGRCKVLDGSMRGSRSAIFSMLLYHSLVRYDRFAKRLSMRKDLSRRVIRVVGS